MATSKIIKTVLMVTITNTMLFSSDSNLRAFNHTLDRPSCGSITSDSSSQPTNGSVSNASIVSILLNKSGRKDNRTSPTQDSTDFWGMQNEF